MNERLQQESRNLERAWRHHDPAWLRDYLVSDVEDPRLNVQSILSRHFLIEAVLGRPLEALMNAELRFATVMNWLLGLVRQAATADDFQAILHALRHGADNAEGIDIPFFVTRTFQSLPEAAEGVEVPNYLASILENGRFGSQPPRLDEGDLSLFERIWAQRLASETGSGLSVIEPACGSANDYRFIHRFGIARLVRYTGFDLCQANIRNAQTLFPEVRFELGNALEVPREAKSFDLCFVHDLFEHLSIEAMEHALAEVCRVTRKAVCIGFFDMHEDREHVVRPVEDYHVNSLSLPRILERLEQHGGNVEAVHVGTLLRWRVGCESNHNPNAYTVIARFRSEGAAG